MLDQEADVNEERQAGAAATELQADHPTGFSVNLVLKTPRPEYGDNARRVCKKFTEICQLDGELAKAFAYLADDTAFMLVFEPKEKKRIIVPR